MFLKIFFHFPPLIFPRGKNPPGITSLVKCISQYTDTVFEYNTYSTVFIPVQISNTTGFVQDVQNYDRSAFDQFS